MNFLWKSIQKVVSLSQKELEKQDSFSIVFSMIAHDFIALYQKLFKHVNPVLEEGGILVLHKTTHITSSLFPKWPLLQAGFELRKQEVRWS